MDQERGLLVISFQRVNCLGLAFCFCPCNDKNVWGFFITGIVIAILKIVHNAAIIGMIVKNMLKIILIVFIPLRHLFHIKLNDH